MYLTKIKISCLFFVVLSLQGCSSIKDVSARYPYSEKIGKTYILQHDCYIFRFKDSWTIYVGQDIYGLPKEVVPNFVNNPKGDDIILGVAPKGSVFKVVGCNEARTPENITQEYQAVFEDRTAAFPELIVNVMFLTDYTKTPPVFDIQLAKLAGQ